MASKPVAIKDEVLNDLATRFLINIPDEDKDDPLKLCSHIEIAHWFYLDLIRPEDPSLPGCSMKEFMATIFQHCPFLVRDSVSHDTDTLHTQWRSHKHRKPTRGAIILNQDLTKCLLVQGYPASTSWGFPKGKLERGESDKDCAIREVYEETGFDIRALIRDGQYLECQSQDSERVSRMYIIPGVPEGTEFKPRVRKEIGNIGWFRLEDLPRHKKDLTARQNLGKNPNSFFMVIPFISQLKKWIASYVHRKRNESKSKTSRSVSATFHNPTSTTTQQQRRSTSSPLTSVAKQRTSNKSTPPRASPQSVPKRAVSGPVGVRPEPRPLNPLVGGYLAAGTTQPLPPVMRSYSIPNVVPTRGQIGYQTSTQHPPAFSGHSHHHHHHTQPPLHTRHPIGHSQAPVPHHVTLLPTPHHLPHLPHPHNPHNPHTSHFVPHTTSVFNPVLPPPGGHLNFNPLQTATATHVSTPPADKFNPFAALGISTTAVNTTTSVSQPVPVPPASTPRQWDENGPVQVHLKPAQSWVRFQFDKSRILSAL